MRRGASTEDKRQQGATDRQLEKPRQVISGHYEAPRFSTGA
jgi:hypothetical protein